MHIIQTNDSDFKSKIISLYVETFATGESSQFIDLDELNKYVDYIFEKGNILVCVDNENIIGALLSCPLAFDNLLPAEIRQNYFVEKCVYVAEMMVVEHARGNGLGKLLLNKFFETVNIALYTDAFIRVWDKNLPAIALYKKLGFEFETSIEQTKTKVDGSGTFVMNKLYLHKKITE
jgi:ribosomal protein S18 acetylase RimI-like enzyme